MLVARLRYHLLPRTSERQYGFVPQKSTEDSLYTLINYIRKKLDKKKIVTLVSLDIEGAFDSAWWPAIRVRLAEEQAFADDVVMVFEGETALEIENKANAALSHALAWGVENKLKFAPLKTCAMVITRRLVYDEPRLSMGGVGIAMSRDVKILGLTIDDKLTFNKHVASICSKALNRYKMLARTARVGWGLHPEIIRLIYTAAIEPTIMYAASAWAPAVKKLGVIKQLKAVQRGFAQKLCKAYRTVSLNSALLLSGLLPLDLRVREMASLYETKKGARAPVALEDREIEAMTPAVKAPHPAEREEITFERICGEEQYQDCEKLQMRIYTDGSRIDGKVGAALSIWKDASETKAIKLALSSYCTVYQAELLALNRATKEAERATAATQIGIFSDSMAALQATVNPNSRHPLAVESREMIKRCKDQNKNLSLFWIKAHAGLPGNERADELAKAAALKLKKSPDYSMCPISFVKRNLRIQTMSEWNQRYVTGETASVTKTFFPDALAAYRVVKKMKVEAETTQLMTGHGGFSSYLYQYKCKDNPSCTCDPEVEETVLHLRGKCVTHTTEALGWAPVVMWDSLPMVYPLKTPLFAVSTLYGEAPGTPKHASATSPAAIRTPDPA
ncbi:uncharacterized protein LOC133531843 [Cydia pomonella]|uniref:uncharacterized protein LOC133531843 n=1 Tax=Cydia pomonella TaxID=82600 RepID=UPI002ADDAD17|nr:uncharacterized protein LOC133531843 [Cydia pomonella]